MLLAIKSLKALSSGPRSCKSAESSRDAERSYEMQQRSRWCHHEEVRVCGLPHFCDQAGMLKNGCAM